MAGIPKDEFCYMDKLPVEVRQKIFGLAVMLKKDVTPIQVKKRSNKFLWDKAQTGQNGISAVQPLTAVQLSRCSKAIYAEVATTHLFYRVNHFDFTDVSEFIKFIVAITRNRAMAIQSISTTYGFKWFGTRYLQDQPFFTDSDQQLTFLDSSVMDMHFAALRACYGLQHLEFVFHYDVYEHYYHKKLTKKNVHPDLVVAVQGLRTLKIKVSDYKSAFTNRDHYDTLVLNTQTCRESLAHVLGKAALVDKAKVYQPSKFFSRVIDWASLDIDGDGRLSEDRKPGVVASRTRQATKNLSTMDAFGVIPKDACPKYSIDGELSWDIDIISDARASDDILYPVEFLCALRHRDADDKYMWVIPHESKTWENLGVLSSAESRKRIVDFYTINLQGYGKKLVLDVWKTGGARRADGNRPGDKSEERWDTEDSRYKANSIKDLEKLISKAEFRAAEAAKKREQAEKAKEAKEAKKAAKGKAKGGKKNAK